MTMSAVLTTAAVARTISEGEAGVMMHGPTFMGNPLACAVAVASLDLLNSQPMAQIVGNIEQQLRHELAPAKDMTDRVADVRVIGSIGVVEMKEPVNVGRFQRECVKRGIWVRPFGKMVYIMPPYVISNDDLHTLATEMLNILRTDEWR
jgi:adenosylmethionine-8-amino-7-oxononanoate aminotransferase